MSMALDSGPLDSATSILSRILRFLDENGVAPSREPPNLPNAKSLPPQRPTQLCPPPTASFEHHFGDWQINPLRMAELNRHTLKDLAPHQQRHAADKHSDFKGSAHVKRPADRSELIENQWRGASSEIVGAHALHQLLHAINSQAQT